MGSPNEDSEEVANFGYSCCFVGMTVFALSGILFMHIAKFHNQSYGKKAFPTELSSKIGEIVILQFCWQKSHLVFFLF